MLCHAQSHRCRRSHHPCSPQGPTHERHRAGTRAPAALALGMCGPTAPPKYAPTCKHVPCECKHPAAWCSMFPCVGEYTVSLPAGQPHWCSPGSRYFQVSAWHDICQPVHKAMGSHSLLKKKPCWLPMGFPYANLQAGGSPEGCHMLSQERATAMPASLTPRSPAASGGHRVCPLPASWSSRP